MTIEVPHNWQPRPYQMPAWSALEGGCRRAILVWHRKAGKDLLALNWTVTQAVERVGVYWHVFPTARQGRKIVWDGVTKDGRTFLDHWPRELVARKSDTEMKLKLRNDSVWQVVGSDNYDEALIGGNPVGLVMSEYALQNPSCWDFLRPVLAENGGWAIFPYTPRGRNHGHKLFEMARKNPDWFAERLGASMTGAVSRAAIEAERAAGMPDELIEQEFECSFEASMVGSYYGKLMSAAEAQGRITSVPYDPLLEVETWWDIGVHDATAIWFVQRAGRETRLIDYYEAAGVGLDHYVKVLRERDYAYARHIAPFDIEVKEFGSGRTRLEQAASLGVRFRVAPRVPQADGINAVRTLLPSCWFDATRCEKGIEALRMYQKEWDEERKVFNDAPLHDWTSHACDAFRYGALMQRGKPAGFAPAPNGGLRTFTAASADWNPLA